MNTSPLGRPGPVSPPLKSGPFPDLPEDLVPLQDQVLASRPQATPQELKLGTLMLWEKTLPPATSFPPVAGRLNGYFAALNTCLKAFSGPLTPALGQALESLQPESMLSRDSNGFTYLNSDLKLADIFQLSHKLDGGQSLAGVTCTGLWNAEEVAVLGKALEKLQKAVPHQLHKLQGIVVQTWIGARDPERQSENVMGNVDSHSPGIFRLSRAGLRSSQLEQFLFHEFAHLVDRGERSSAEDFDFQSPKNPAFVGQQDPRRCVTPYASTAVYEDFAETMAFCIEHLDTMESHPDLYFHAMGPLSAKFRDIFENQLQRPIPPPSPRWEALRTAIQDGTTPFGVRNPQGKVMRGLYHLREAAKFLSVDGPIKDVEKRIEAQPDGAFKEQLRFLKGALMDGQLKPTQVPDSTQIEKKLADSVGLRQRLSEIDARLREVEAACKSYPDPSAVPPNHTLSAANGFGSRAMNLRKVLESLEGRPPQVWKPLVEQSVQDPDLHARLHSCQDFAAVKTVVQERMDQMMDYFTACSDRHKSENVPQERDLLYEERHQLSPRLDPLQKELHGLVHSLQSDLKKVLSNPLALRAYQDLLSQP